MKSSPDQMQIRNSGFTVLEVIVAIFIFGCVSAALFTLIAQTERIRGRANFVETAVSLASNEAERLRNIAAQNGVFEDSSFIESVSGITCSVKRHIIETSDSASLIPHPREPVAIEMTIANASNSEVTPLRFKLLVGNDRP